MAMQGGSSKSVPMSVKMKEVGRGVAKAENQKSSKTVRMAQGDGGGSKPYGGGQFRGSKGQSSGKNWKGVT